MTDRSVFMPWQCAGQMILAVALMSTISCGGGKMALKQPKGVTVISHASVASLRGIKRIAVLDFHEQAADAVPGAPNLCPVTGLHFIRGSTEPGSGAVVAEIAREKLEEKGFDVIEPNLVLDAINDIGHPDYTVDLGAKVGQALNAHAVVMGSVMRFEERIGGKLSVDKPAAVGFSMVFISVPSGDRLWQAKFEKTQKPLSSNILDYQTFVKGGMVWQKAGKLAEIGVGNMLDTLTIRPVSK